MKIVEVNIYGYGKFENLIIAPLQDQQVFYGENEAGKSTIMSFIHSILFGFPTRQGTELRYEPKKGAKYGGQLTVVFPERGKAVIERVKGKAAGDVSVHLENGMVGGEELLKELLSSIDKNVFQAIFSFNLHGLQNIHQMKGEDLGRFLFSTGTLGTDRLMKVENELTKELDSRFKPNGRNPELNVKLKELREAAGELKKAEENNEQYISLLRKMDTLNSDIDMKMAATASLAERAARLEELIKIQPIIREEKLIKNELLDYADIIIPDNGLQQLDHLKGLQTPIQRKTAILAKRIDTLQEELIEIKPDFELIEKEADIDRGIESLPLIQKWKEEVLQLQVKLKKIDEDINLLQMKIHLSLTTEDILSANTSVFMREKAADLQEKQNRLKDKKLELDDLFKEAKRRLEELEMRAASLEKQLLPDSHRQKLKERLSQTESKENIAAKSQDVKERLNFLIQSLKQAENNRRKDKGQYIFLIILFIALGVWGWFSQVILMTVISGIGLIFSLFSILRKNAPAPNEEHLKSEIKKWQGKDEELSEILNKPDEHIELLKDQVKKDEMLREELQHLNIKLDRQKEFYDHVIDGFESWENESLDLKEKLLTAGKELKLPEDIALNYLLNAFQIIDNLKKNVQEKEYILEQCDTKKKAIENVLGEIRKLNSMFFKYEAIQPEESILTLKRKVRSELEKQIRYKEKEEQLAILQEELKELNLEFHLIQEEINALFTSVNAQNEDHFREIAKQAEQKLKLIEHLGRLSVQLKITSLKEDEVEKLAKEPNLESVLQEARDRKEVYTEELNQLQEERAQLKYSIGLLEEGGTYAELLHSFKQLKSEFIEGAKEWAIYAMAKDLLQKTIQTFKEDRLPKMLTEAEKYLSFLTDGHYIRIIPKQEGSGFLIERNDHLLFEANELSQATTEQIYVSIRLALAITVYEKYKFPIIIDDSFVNFDRNRTRKIVELLKKFTDHQILFFTCHEHLLQYFDWAEVIHLNDINSVAENIII